MKESTLIKLVNTIEVERTPYSSLIAALKASRDQKSKLTKEQKSTTTFRII